MRPYLSKFPWWAGGAFRLRRIRGRRDLLPSGAGIVRRMDLDAEMPEVQCCEHASIGARRQNHRHRLAEKADVCRGPALRAAAQLEQALAGGDPGAVIHGVSPFDDDDSAAAQSLQHVNAAVGCEWIGERCAVGAAPSIDKYDDVA